MTDVLYTRPWFVPSFSAVQGITGVLHTRTWFIPSLFADVLHKWPWFVPSFLAYKKCLMFCITKPWFIPSFLAVQGITGVLHTRPWFFPSLSTYKECLVFCIQGLGLSQAFWPTRSDWCSEYMALVCPQLFGLQGVSDVLCTHSWFIPSF